MQRDQHLPLPAEGRGQKEKQRHSGDQQEQPRTDTEDRDTGLTTLLTETQEENVRLFKMYGTGTRRLRGEQGHPARVHPKGKAPGDKHRLIISYGKTPLQGMIAVGSGALQRLPCLLAAKMNRKHLGVDTVGQVLQRITDFNARLLASDSPIRPGWKIQLRKCDFEQFFLKADRQEVLSSIRFWLDLCDKHHPGRKAFAMLRPTAIAAVARLQGHRPSRPRRADLARGGAPGRYQLRRT